MSNKKSEKMKPRKIADTLETPKIIKDILEGKVQPISISFGRQTIYVDKDKS